MPLACLAIAGVAVAAALLTKSHHVVRLKQAPYVGFPSITGITWDSVADPGQVTVSGHGTYWLAFRGFALGRGGSFSLLGDSGTRRTVSLGSEPAIHFVGPLVLNGITTYWLAPNSGTTRSRGAGDGRIFLSGYKLLPRPLAALPGPGFWPTEVNIADGTYANWLDTRGRLDLASFTRVPRVWLAFDATSVDTRRTLTISQGAKTFRIAVPERGASRHVTVGPFKLDAGVAQVLFESPNPIVSGSDARSRTIRVTALDVRRTPPAH